MPHYIDYIVIGLFLLICMIIGIFHGFRGRKYQTPEYYLVGNRHLQLLPVSISFFVTYLSAISLMGLPAEMYNYGTMVLWGSVGHVASLVFGAFNIVPMVHPLKLTSAFEYLELRFKSRVVRLLGTGLSMLQTTLYLGIALYAPALTLETVAGIPLWASVVIVGGISVVYTSIGGIKSVIWTDTLQCVILFSGTITVIIMGFSELGNPDKLRKALEDGKRLQYYEFNPDPRIRHTIWGLIIGTFFQSLSNWCGQSSIQRISSLKTEYKAKCSFLLCIPFGLVDSALLATLGLLVYAYYHIKRCDPIEAGHINSANQLMPYFVFDVMKSYPGLPGLYISVLFSGCLSTLSSGLNSLAANTVEDLLKNQMVNFADFQVTIVAKIAVFVYGGLAIGVAYAVQSLSGPVTQITNTVFGAFGGPVAGLFFLGAVFPFTNWIGALCGGLIGITVNIWIGVGNTLYGNKAPKLESNPTDYCFPQDIINVTTTSTNAYLYNFSIPTHETTIESATDRSPYSGFYLYNISYVWYGFIGFGMTIIFGIIISCFTGKGKYCQTEAKYLFPFCRRFVKNSYLTEKPDLTTEHVTKVLEQNKHSSIVDSQLRKINENSNTVIELPFTTFPKNDRSAN